MRIFIIAASTWLVLFAMFFAIRTIVDSAIPSAAELDPVISAAMSAGADRQAQSLIAELDRMTAELQRLNEQLRAMNEGPR